MYKYVAVYRYLCTLFNFVPLYLVTEIAGTRPKESSIMPLSIGLGGAVILFVITVAVSVAILIKSRKNILSQKVDTQHYTKPPAGNIHKRYCI